MQCFLCFACFPKITRNPYVKAYNLRFCVSLGSQPNHQGSSTVCSIFSVALPPVLKEWFSELPIFFFCFLSSLQFSVPKDNRKIGKKPSIHTDPLFLDYKIKRTKLVMTFQQRIEKRKKNSHGFYKLGTKIVQKLLGHPVELNKWKIG